MNQLRYASSDRISWPELLNPILVFRSLVKHKELIAIYSNREFTQSYRGTFLGLAWIVVNPLIMLTIYTIVFGYIFQSRFNIDIEETKVDFTLALFVGLSLYNLLAYSLSASATLMKANASFVKNLSFPVEILPLSVVLNALFSFAINVALIGLLFLIFKGFIHLTILYLIPITVCVALAGLGFAWLVASVGVFLRDIPSIIAPLLSVLMLFSAVFFPLSMVPENLRGFIMLNPLAVLIDEARGCVMYGEIPNLGIIGIYLAVSLAFAIAGYAIFMRMKVAFADVL